MRPIVACALLLVALSSAACHVRKAVTLDQITTLKPNRVWVTTSDQSVVVVTGAQVLGDTLVGYINGHYEEMPSSQLKQFVVERPATTRTVLLVTVMAAGLGGMAYALAGGGQGNKFTPDYCEEHSEDPGCMAL